MTISVVIVNWNSRDDLALCLRSLRAQTDRDFEVVVVDNGSSDGSVDMLRAEFPEVTLVDAGDNLGFAEGVNRGIDACHGEWIATLNNDAEADPSWIATLRGSTRSDDTRLGMIQSCILFKHAPERVNSTGVQIHKNGSFIDRKFDAPVASCGMGEEIFCVSAGAALYKREMLDETRLESGVFDRSFFMYYEDVDLGWRCRLAGWTAVYQPSAIVYHAFHGSASRRGRNFVFEQCRRNRVRTLLKNASPMLLLRAVPLTVRHLVSDVLASGVSVLPQYAAAIVDAWPQRRSVKRLAVVHRRAVERRWAVPGNA